MYGGIAVLGARRAFSEAHGFISAVVHAGRTPTRDLRHGHCRHFRPCSDSLSGSRPDERASRPIAAAWAARVRADLFPLLAWIGLRKVPDPARAYCQAALLQQLEGTRMPWFVHVLPWLQESSLRRSVLTWGALGAALMGPLSMSAARRWLATWREYLDAQTWMLSNVVYAFMVKRPLEAKAALERALSHPPDANRDHLCVSALWFEACFGSGQSYQTASAAADQPGLAPHVKSQQLLARAVALARGFEAPDLEPKARFETVKQLIRRRSSCPVRRRGISTTEASVVRRCGRSGASPECEA